MKLSGLTRYLYRDYLMGNRLAAYRKVLQQALSGGFEIIGVAEWMARRSRGDDEGKTLILRHDIDTDPQTALEMARILRELGVGASFYFRRSTFDLDRIRAVAALGFDIGYHYEEVADFAKVNGVFDPEQIRARMDEVRALFTRNLRELRERSGLALNLVCSHGDWVNRRLDMTNYRLLEAPGFAESVDVHEVYGGETLKGVLCITDSASAEGWTQSPSKAFREHDGPIHILVHPRQWRSSWRHNTAETLVRVREAIAHRGR